MGRDSGAEVESIMPIRDACTLTERRAAVLARITGRSFSGTASCQLLRSARGR